jgi:hypothetical protein
VRERKALENHGYLVCDAAIQTRPRLVQLGANQGPHPEWMDDKRVRVDLTDSDRRKLLGRW